MTPSIPKNLVSGRLFLSPDAVLCFSQPLTICDYLHTVQRAGCGGILTLGDERVIAELRRFVKTDPGRDFQVLPIIPNVSGYVREATEYGLVGAGLRRLARAGLTGFISTGLAGMRHPFRVLQKHFPTLLTILFALEMGELGRFKPPAVFLHHQMTDLLLSFDNRAFFEDYARIMRKRYHTEPGLVTSNFAALTEKLTAWDVPISLIVAPLNRENFLMPGGLETYQKALATGRYQLIADRVSPEDPTPPEAVEWVLAQDGVVAVAQ